MYFLTNGIELHERHPETFWIPSADDKSAIQVGDFVKLVFVPEDAESSPAERMWVEVTSRGGDVWHGTLANAPYRMTGLRYGAVIEFQACHIISILSRQEALSA